jgi:hypothetical protein
LIELHSKEEVEKLKAELQEAKETASIMETFMHEYYALHEHMDKLLVFIYDRLGKIGIEECDVCDGSGGSLLGVDENNIKAWGHPASNPCEECAGLGRNTMAAMHDHHVKSRKRIRNRDRFKESNMRVVKD